MNRKGYLWALGIIILIVGFSAFHKSTKTRIRESLLEADKLWTEGKKVEAANQYLDLWKEFGEKDFDFSDTEKQELAPLLSNFYERSIKGCIGTFNVDRLKYHKLLEKAQKIIENAEKNQISVESNAIAMYASARYGYDAALTEGFIGTATPIASTVNETNHPPQEFPEASAISVEDQMMRSIGQNSKKTYKVSKGFLSGKVTIELEPNCASGLELSDFEWDEPFLKYTTIWKGYDYVDIRKLRWSAYNSKGVKVCSSIFFFNSIQIHEPTRMGFTLSPNTNWKEVELIKIE